MLLWFIYCNVTNNHASNLFLAMNIETVVNALQATTSNDNAVRKNAESALHEVLTSVYT